MADIKKASWPAVAVGPDANRLAVMIYVRYPLWLRQVEDLLFEHGIHMPWDRAVRF